jgi:hypothetical protein
LSEVEASNPQFAIWRLLLRKTPRNDRVSSRVCSKMVTKREIAVRLYVLHILTHRTQPIRIEKQG